METNIIQDRINHIILLLNRVDVVENKLKEIEKVLSGQSLSQKEFATLATQRANLLIEQRNKKKELRECYHLVEEEEYKRYQTIL